MLSFDTLLSAANALYQQAEKYKDNENRIKVLTDEIKIITDIVTGGRKSDFFDTDGDPKEDENIKPALKDLYQSIQDTQAFITEFETVYAKNLDKAWQFIKKFIKANGYEQHITEIHDRLKSCQDRLSLGGVLQGLKNNKKYEEARQADAKIVQSQLEIIQTQVKTGGKTGEITVELVTQMMLQLKTLQESFDAKPAPVTRSVVVKKADKFIAAPVGIQGGDVEFLGPVDPVLYKLILENRKSEASDLAAGLGELDPSLTSNKDDSTSFTVEEAKIVEKFDKARAGGGKISVVAASSAGVTTFKTPKQSSPSESGSSPSSSSSASSSSSSGSSASTTTFHS